MVRYDLAMWRIMPCPLISDRNTAPVIGLEIAAILEYIGSWDYLMILLTMTRSIEILSEYNDEIDRNLVGIQFISELQSVQSCIARGAFPVYETPWRKKPWLGAKC